MRSSRLTLLSALAAAGLLAISTVGVAAQDADEGGGVTIAAAAVPITVDGDASDWADVERTTLVLEQLDLDALMPEQAEEIDFGAVDPIEVQLAVANDADNIYVLVEVPTPYDYVADDHGLSPALAVEAPIQAESSVHMGAEEEDLFISTGMVDLWHWELDCGPGELSGGQGVAGGDDAACNLDDEYSTTPEMREDDGGGDEPNDAAENSLSGVLEPQRRRARWRGHLDLRDVATTEHRRPAGRTVGSWRTRRAGAGLVGSARELGGLV